MEVGVVSVRKNSLGQYNQIKFDFGEGMKSWGGKLKVHGEWFDISFESPFGLINWLIANYGVTIIKIVEVNDLDHIRFYIQAPVRFSVIEMNPGS